MIRMFELAICMAEEEGFKYLGVGEPEFAVLFFSLEVETFEKRKRSEYTHLELKDKLGTPVGAERSHEEVSRKVPDTKESHFYHS